jgi:hypothetical protein
MLGEALFGAGTFEGDGPEPAWNASYQRIMIVGPAKSGRASMAFKLAYEEAERGGAPLFICKKSQLQSLPLEIRSSSNDGNSNSYLPEVLQAIRMKYVESSAELRQVLCAVQIFQNPLPSLIVIENLSSIIDSNAMHTMRSDIKFIDEYLYILALTVDALQSYRISAPTINISSATINKNSTDSHKNDSINPRLVVTDIYNSTIYTTRGIRRFIDRILKLDSSTSNSANEGYKLSAMATRTNIGGSASSGNEVVLYKHIELVHEHNYAYLLLA